MTATVALKTDKDVRDLLLKAIQNRQQALSEYESKLVVSAAGVPVVQEVLVHSRQEAMDQETLIGFPVVLKGSSHTLTHKTEMGMVLVNLKNREEAAQAYDTLLGKGIDLDGVLIQKMVQGKREFVIGLTRDPHFGPCVMFGIGGIFTEAMKDVSFRVAPLTEEYAQEMISEIRAVKLLDAFRGEGTVNRDALVKALVGIGNLGMAYDEIAEIDINPLIVTESKPVAVDALVILNTRRS